MQTSASHPPTTQTALPPLQVHTVELSIGIEVPLHQEVPSSDRVASAQTQQQTVQICISQDPTIRGIPSIVHVLHTTAKHTHIGQAVEYKHAFRDQAAPAQQTPEEEEVPQRMLCM